MWLNSDEIEERKSFVRVSVEVRNAFGIGGLELPRANSSSRRMRERPHIDRSQSNIYRCTTMYTDGGGPPQLNTEAHSTAMERNLTVIDSKSSV